MLELIKHSCYCIRGYGSSLGAFSSTLNIFIIVQMNHIFFSLLSSHSFFPPPIYPPNHSFPVSVLKASGLPRRSAPSTSPWMEASLSRGDTFIHVQSLKMLKEKESSFSLGMGWRDFPERMNGSFLLLEKFLFIPRKLSMQTCSDSSLECFQVLRQ